MHAKEIHDECKRIVTFLKQLEAKGFVIGVSGGVDSAVALALCSRAVGSENVVGLVLPFKHTPIDDINDAEQLCSKYAVWNLINLEPILDLLVHSLPVSNPLTRGNLIARLRMVILYYYANMLGYLVCGTTDKSEHFLGYFTKFGDGAADVEPLLHLTKSQIKQLAKYLNIPSNIIDKPSSPQLYAEHEAEKELGFSYELLDRILSLNVASGHKRKQPHSLRDASS